MTRLGSHSHRDRAYDEATGPGQQAWHGGARRPTDTLDLIAAETLEEGLPWLRYPVSTAPDPGVNRRPKGGAAGGS
jgi:hypothetical protein